MRFVVPLDGEYEECADGVEVSVDVYEAVLDETLE